MTQLIPDGVAPEFTTKQEKSETHRHVAKVWFDKCLSYDDVYNQIDTGVRNREDITDAIGSMKPTVQDGKFGFEYSDGRFFIPTDHALSQMGVHLKTSTYGLRELRENKDEIIRDEQDAQVLKAIVDNALRRVDLTTKRKWRTYNDGTLRAWVSAKYAEIDNRWYLDIVNSLIPEGRFSHWNGNEDTFIGNVLIPDSIMVKPEWDSEYGGLISVSNCEIGMRRLESTPGVFRAICMNGCIWNQKKGNSISQVHRGKIDLVTLKKKIVDNIMTQIPLAHDGIQTLLDTMQKEADVAMAAVIGVICKESNFSQKESVEVIGQYSKFEQDHKNLFGVINAITRASQKMNGLRADEMDNIAGGLVTINQNKWDSILSRAKTFGKEDIKKVFNLSL